MCVCVRQDLVLCRKVPLGVSGPLNSLNKRPWEYCWLRSLSWYCGCPMGDYCGTRPSVSQADYGKLVPRRLHTHITDTHHSNQTLFFAPPVDRWAVCPALVKGALWFYPLWSGFCHQLPSLMWVSRVRSQGRCPGFWHQQATHNP